MRACSVGMVLFRLATVSIVKRGFYNKKVTAQRNGARVLVQYGFDQFCIVVEI